MKQFAKGPRLIVALVAMALVGVAAIPATLGAADHLDAPGLTSPGGDGRLDITDVYAFKKGTNTVLIMGVNPAAGVFSPLTFNQNASYEFKIDTNGDAREDSTYKVDFGAPDGGDQSVRLRKVPAKGGSAVIAEGTTGEDISVEGGGTLHAGLFDDPFFFDLAAFLGAYNFCEAEGEGTNTGSDFFAGLNVSAIVLEVPSSSLGPNNIGVWARTELNGDQVDRMGRPAINTVFIPSDSKNAYNESKPRQDAKRFSQFLGDFASVLLPDILTIDTSSSAGFLNGRQLADDVIDIELGLIFGAGASDCVDGNDVSFSGTFPYLADPH